LGAQGVIKKLGRPIFFKKIKKFKTAVEADKFRFCGPIDFDFFEKKSKPIEKNSKIY
jgi:hypothetical protein